MTMSYAQNADQGLNAFLCQISIHVPGAWNCISLHYNCFVWKKPAAEIFFIFSNCSLGIYHTYLVHLFMYYALLCKADFCIYVYAEISPIQLCTNSNSTNAKNKHAKHQQWKQFNSKCVNLLNQEWGTMNFERRVSSRFTVCQNIMAVTKESAIRLRVRMCFLTMLLYILKMSVFCQSCLKSEQLPVLGGMIWHNDNSSVMTIEPSVSHYG